MLLGRKATNKQNKLSLSLSPPPPSVPATPLSASLLPSLSLPPSLSLSLPPSLSPSLPPSPPPLDRVHDLHSQ